MLFELPDGGSMDLPMEYMDVKDSLFIPTLKADEAQAKLYLIADKLEFKIVTRTCIVDGFLGVQLWRVQ